MDGEPLPDKQLGSLRINSKEGQAYLQAMAGRSSVCCYGRFFFVECEGGREQSLACVVTCKSAEIRRMLSIEWLACASVYSLIIIDGRFFAFLLQLLPISVLSIDR